MGQTKCRESSLEIESEIKRQMILVHFLCFCPFFAHHLHRYMIKQNKHKISKFNFLKFEADQANRKCKHLNLTALVNVTHILSSSA